MAGNSTVTLFQFQIWRDCVSCCSIILYQLLYVCRDITRANSPCFFSLVPSQIIIESVCVRARVRVCHEINYVKLSSLRACRNAHTGRREYCVSFSLALQPLCSSTVVSASRIRVSSPSPIWVAHCLWIPNMRWNSAATTPSYDPIVFPFRDCNARIPPQPSNNRVRFFTLLIYAIN